MYHCKTAVEVGWKITNTAQQLFIGCKLINEGKMTMTVLQVLNASTLLRDV